MNELKDVKKTTDHKNMSQQRTTKPQGGRGGATHAADAGTHTRHDTKTKASEIAQSATKQKKQAVVSHLSTPERPGNELS